MADLGLDASGNFLKNGGRLVTVTGSAAVKQALRIKLRTLLGEWFRDRSEGVDYRDEILNRDFQASRVDREIRRNVMQVNGVQSIIRITVEPNFTTQRVHVTVRYRDTFGTSDTLTLEVLLS